MDGARSLFEEAIDINREIGSHQLAGALANLAQLESSTGRFDRAIEALQEALVLDQQQGDCSAWPSTSIRWR
jgi:tetratricopeptide (TPR) repeat protein